MALILCIDDDGQLLTYYRRVLEEQGNAVLTAGTGLEGLRVLRQQPVDLVITDILMPEMDGIELIRQLRSWANPPPIIALSGGGRQLGGKNLLAAASAYGVRATLHKPFLERDLLQAVALVLG